MLEYSTHKMALPHYSGPILNHLLVEAKQSFEKADNKKTRQVAKKRLVRIEAEIGRRNALSPLKAEIEERNRVEEHLAYLKRHERNKRNYALAKGSGDNG